VKAVPADFPMGFNSVADYFGIADALQAGEASFASGDNHAGVDSLRKAFAASQAINYDEPPDWDLPVAEFLGPALLKTKLYADAEAIYRTELGMHPNNGRGLLGLGEALRQQKKTAEAVRIDIEFKKAWTESDPPMTARDLYR
jgi:hypothetical protein